METRLSGAQAFERMKEVLLAARDEFGRDETKRLERVFLEYAGVKPRSESPHPLQRPGFFCRGLGLRPWYESEEWEQSAVLESHFETIRDEVLNAPADAIQAYDNGIAPAENWGVLFVRFGSAPVEKNRSICPRTIEIVNGLERAGEMSMVSILKPHTRIKPHCGPFNLKVTMHLALKVPPNCFLKVAGEPREWVEGKCLVFDDSFEHEAANDSDRARTVLIVDFWHPDLSDAEVRVLDRIMDITGKASDHIDRGYGGFELERETA